MTGSDANHRSKAASPPTAAPVAYRCVCGDVVFVAVGHGGTCSACGRHYSSEILKTAVAETVSLPEIHADNDAATLPANVAVADDALIGQTFGHFRIVAKLGQGGMGSVYRALDTSLQRYVALKIIHRKSRSSSSVDHVQQLLQEAIAQARVNHPNVVHIYYVGRHEQNPFFAMEIVSGPTLTDRLASGPLPYAAIIELALQIADALDHTAKYDIVHGDIKPSNILLADGQTVKLSDFGLARRLSEAAQETAGVVGTPNYLAPEVIQGARPDVRSDMYSLGVTLFEMTFGRLPYSTSSGSLSETFRAHQEAPIEFPDPWPPDLPQGWRDVLARLLAKSPGERYESYGQLIGDLRELQPIALPRAGRLQRALAWLVDLALLYAPLMLYLAAIQAGNELLRQRHLARWILSAAAGFVPLAGCYFAMRWGTTPGKKLFQLRIVDRHGLRPLQSILGARAVIQFAPIWTIVAAGVIVALVPTPAGKGLAAMLGVIALASLLVDAGFALFYEQGRSLHDLFFGTRVVLDATNPSTQT